MVSMLLISTGLHFCASTTRPDIKNIQEIFFEIGCLKSDNITDAFSFGNLYQIDGGKVLLVDDIFDSGAIIKEIGRYFTNLGVVMIAPLVI